MPLAAALGSAGPEFESDEYPLPAVEPRRVALVGVPLARRRRAGAADASSNARVFTMSDLDRLGIEAGDARGA